MFESTAGRDENKDASSSRCKLVAPKRRSTIPPTLTVTCKDTDEPHGGKATSKTVRYELPTS
jgi:hypothetical protein